MDQIIPSSNKIENEKKKKRRGEGGGQVSYTWLRENPAAKQLNYPQKKERHTV